MSSSHGEPSPELPPEMRMPIAPPLNEERHRFYSGEGNERIMSRREFGIMSALAAVAVAFRFETDIVTPTAQIASAVRWPDRDASIEPVDKRRLGVHSNRMLFAFPGFGVMDTYNAAHEQDAAFKGTEHIASAFLPTHKFDEYELGEVWWDTIQRYKVTQVGILGHSAGLPTGYLSYKAIHERVQNWARQDKLPTNTTLPRLRGVFGNCSPTSIDDAHMIPQLRWLGERIKESGFSVDLRHKYAYDYVDGEGDLSTGLNYADIVPFLRHLVETGQQTFNNTAPNTGLSQAEILFKFNWLQQCMSYEPVLDTKTEAIQVEPIAKDKTVDQVQTPKKWGEGYKLLNVPNYRVINYEDPEADHANTVAFANVMAAEKFRGAVLAS